MQRFGKQHGFSLIELMISLVILGIATCCAVPSFRSMLLSTQSRAARDTLLTSLNLARSTALSNFSNIVVCPSDDAQTCSGKTTWQNGWIVFQDSNGDGKRNGSEALLSVGQRQAAGQAILSTEGRNHVTYRPDGSASGTNLTISFCDARGAAQASAIVVNNAGRPRTGKPTAQQAADACAAI